MDAWIDNTVIKEQLIHKIVEVGIKSREKGVKWAAKDKKKKKKRTSSHQDSDEEKLEVTDEEYTEIKKDIKTIKGILKTMK